MWRQDGKELFFWTTDGAVMSAEVNGSGTTFTVGKTDALFSVPPSVGLITTDVTADGQRFLSFPVVGGQATPPLTLVTNWEKELIKK